MTRITKITTVPMTMWVAFCEHGHAAATSTLPGVIGKVGDDVECIVCASSEKKRYYAELKKHVPFLNEPPFNE